MLFHCRMDMCSDPFSTLLSFAVSIQHIGWKHTIIKQVQYASLTILIIVQKVQLNKNNELFRFPLAKTLFFQGLICKSIRFTY